MLLLLLLLQAVIGVSVVVVVMVSRHGRPVTAVVVPGLVHPRMPVGVVGGKVHLSVG